MSNFLHCYYTYMYLQELVQGYTVGKFWFFSYAYALNFINHCFGSLFWLLGVPIGSLFHKKLGPFFKAWGSLLVRVTVHCLSERSDTIHSIHVTPHLLTCSKKLNVAEVACQLRSLLNNPPSPVQPFILKHFHQSQKYINVIQGGISALLVWRVGRFDTLGKLVWVGGRGGGVQLLIQHGECNFGATSAPKCRMGAPPPHPWLLHLGATSGGCNFRTKV